MLHLRISKTLKNKEKGKPNRYAEYAERVSKSYRLEDSLWSEQAKRQGWHSCASARHRPFVFSLDAQVSTLAYHYASTRTHMHSQLSINISCKIIDNVPFLSTKLSKYSVKCSKLAGELANRSKLLPIISGLSQDLVVSHHRHHINKAKAWCLLAGNYPADLIGKMTWELDPFRLRWTP